MTETVLWERFSVTCILLETLHWDTYLSLNLFRLRSGCFTEDRRFESLCLAFMTCLYAIHDILVLVNQMSQCASCNVGSSKHITLIVLKNSHSHKFCWNRFLSNYANPQLANQTCIVYENFNVDSMTGWFPSSTSIFGHFMISIQTYRTEESESTLKIEWSLSDNWNFLLSLTRLEKDWVLKIESARIENFEIEWVKILWPFALLFTS